MVVVQLEELPQASVAVNSIVDVPNENTPLASVPTPERVVAPVILYE